MLTEETKSIIDMGVENLLTLIEQSVTLGVLEDMSPNDMEYDQAISNGWLSTMEYLDKKLDNYR